MAFVAREFCNLIFISLCLVRAASGVLFVASVDIPISAAFLDTLVIADVERKEPHVEIKGAVLFVVVDGGCMHSCPRPG